MRNWKRWVLFVTLAVLVIGIGYIAFNFIFLDFMVDYWWFDSLGFKTYFLMRLLYRDALFAGVTLFYSFLFFFNFWIASRFLGLSEATRAHLADQRHRRSRRLMSLFQSGSLKVYMPLSLLMGIMIAAPFYEKWEQALLFFGPRAGITDPTFGKDISYFLFQFPVYTLIQSRLIAVFVFLFLALALLYWVEHRLLSREDQKLAPGARVHLNVIAVIVVGIQAWGFLLGRAGLVYTESREPLFYGPGYLEMNFHLPMIWVSMVTFVLAAVAVIWYMNTRRNPIPVLALVALFGLVTIFRGSDFVPDKIQGWFVKPNEAVQEQPYIRNSIDATLAAYGLEEKKISVRDYPLEESPRLITDSSVLEALRNVPVWDRELLDDVYGQLQGFRPYYRFVNVDVDRYAVSDMMQQVFLASRELTTENLPASARNWSNLHLQYTHGNGVVMMPAAQGGDEPMTWFLRDIPARSQYGFQLTRPELYYGESRYSYIVVPNDLGENAYSEQDLNAVTHYEGKGGVPISSLFRKILFAVHFGDKNLLFTGKTNRDSRVLFRRNIQEAIRHVTPFFLLDDDPYIVISEGRLFWIQDAYTTSDLYPNAQRYSRDVSTVGPRNKEFGNQEFNYIRNSVKIVVDAYNGDIDYYMADATDPLIRAYQRIYPGLLKPLDRMPAGLRAHLRYPKSYFSVQMGIYAKYHQTDPGTFYREEDNWAFPRGTDASATPIKPYYLTVGMENGNKPEFLAVLPMSPQGRDNLRALAVVKCDPGHYGEMTIFSFPKGQQVYGPSQISALVTQDTEIAQQLTLWDQSGSQVRFGRMIVLPVAGTILYIQPVYLQSATQLKIPELKRIMVSQGKIMVMERSLEEGLQRLQEKLAEQNRRMTQRLSLPGQISPSEPGPARGEQAAPWAGEGAAGNVPASPPGDAATGGPPVPAN